MPRHEIVSKFVQHGPHMRHRVIIPRAMGGGRRFFVEKKDAEKFIAKLEREQRNGLGKWVALPSHVQTAIMHALEMLGEGRGAEIADAVKVYLQSNRREEKTVADVVAECVADKKNAGCREEYTGPFENLLTRFASHCGPRLMSEVTLEHVKTFINAPKVKAQWIKGHKQYVEAGPAGMKTRKNRKIDLGTLFSYAIKHGYCAENLPLKTERIRIDDKEPGILTVEEATALMVHLRDNPKKRHLLPFAALGLFGGLRPSEAQRLSWSDIGETEIRVAADRGKKRANRFVTINDTLRAWLKHCWQHPKSLPISEPRSRKVREILKTLAPGFVWPKDGLRHSYVSYSVALHGEKLTAMDAGHSEDILRKNYKQLVTRQTAERFWAILPEFATVKKENL